jgi:hypothetical protein
MKKITIILTLILLLSCSSSYNLNRDSVPNGLYYGDNRIIPYGYTIFVDIQNDTAFVSEFYYIKLNYTLTLRDTLYRVNKNNSINQNDTLFSNGYYCTYIYDNNLYFSVIDENKSYFSKENDNVKLDFEIANLAKYNQHLEKSKETMFKDAIQEREIIKSKIKYNL